MMGGNLDLKKKGLRLFHGILLVGNRHGGNLDLKKKGLRPDFVSHVDLLVVWESRPEEKGIKTFCLATDGRPPKVGIST